MKVRRALPLFALIGLFALAASAAAPNFVGTWIGKTEVPDQGTDDLTLVIVKTSTGFEGTVQDTMGIIAPETKITNAKVDGAAMTFNFALSDGTTLVGILKIDGDKISGQWDHPEGDSAPWTFARKK
jgi:RNase P/RNase MRP subunit p29